MGIPLTGEYFLHKEDVPVFCMWCLKCSLNEFRSEEAIHLHLGHNLIYTVPWRNVVKPKKVAQQLDNLQQLHMVLGVGGADLEVPSPYPRGTWNRERVCTWALWGGGWGSGAGEALQGCSS